MLRDASSLRVLMILESGFPVHGGGGAESQVRTLALELRRRGHSVTVLTPRVANAPQKRIQRYQGIAVVRLGYPRLRVASSLVLWCRLAAFLHDRGRRYHAWHAHIAHYMAAIACAFGRHQGRPVLVKISGWWELERGLLASGASPPAALARHALRQASAVQAISTRIAAELTRQRFAPAQILALPNAVDTARFSPSARQPSAAGALQAIFVGRLVVEKGLFTLLDAWATAFGATDGVRLRVVGTGTLEAQLRSRAVALGVGASIEFLGHREDIEALLAEADIGLLPSTIEGLSNTLLEYMAGGLPVVASRISGSEDLVVPGHNGWLFAPGDAAALAGHLREAAAMDPARRRELGAQARRDVVATAGLNVVVDRLVAVYRGATVHASPSTHRS